MGGAMEVTPLPILTSLCYNRPFLDDDFDVITDAPTPAATNAPTQTTCNDGEQDDDETDVDCGGATCKGCDEGLKCNLDADCAGDAIKAEYMEWTREAIAEILRHGVIDTRANHAQAGQGVGSRLQSHAPARGTKAWKTGHVSADP